MTVVVVTCIIKCFMSGPFSHDNTVPSVYNISRLVLVIPPAESQSSKRVEVSTEFILTPMPLGEVCQDSLRSYDVMSSDWIPTTTTLARCISDTAK